MITGQKPRIELVEWQTRDVPTLQLSGEDRAFLRSLCSGNARRLQVDELRQGLRFTATSWVGVVRLTGFEVRVVPKLVGRDLRLLEMLEFTDGIEALSRLPGVHELLSEKSHLFDLIAAMFVQEAERVLRAGLLADYVEEEDELPVLRGRLLAGRQVLERFGRVDRLLCRFDERKQDVVENQLLAAALDACAGYASHLPTRRKARELGYIFREVCDPMGLDLNAARQSVFYDRLNEHYKPAHDLGWLVLGRLGVDNLFLNGSTRVFAFMLDMNLLFERFVARILEQVLIGTSYEILYQRPDRSVIVHADSNKPYARVIPDFLVRHKTARTTRFALDAKYKLYDDLRVAAHDIYQAFVYAHAFTPHGDAVPRAALVYPSESNVSSCRELHVRSAGPAAKAKLYVIGLSVPGILDEIKTGSFGQAVQPLVSLLV